MITGPELCKVLNVGRSRLSKLVSDGLPHKGRRGRSYVFDPEEVRAWTAEHMKPNAVRDAALMAVMGAAPVAAPGEAVNGESFEDTLRRARDAERSAYEFWQSFVIARDAHGAANANKTWRECVENLRRLESSASDIKKSRGEVITKERHTAVVRDMAEIIRAGLMALPAHCAALLVSVEELTEPEIRNVLDKEVKGLLRSFSAPVDEAQE